MGRRFLVEDLFYPTTPKKERGAEGENLGPFLSSRQTTGRKILPS